MRVRLKRNLILFQLFLIIILPILWDNNLIKGGFSYQKGGITSEGDRINLFFSQLINTSEFYFERVISLTKNWEILILNLSIQNLGEALDNIFVSIDCNGITTDFVFNSQIRTGFKNSLAYQFEQSQSLIVPFNYSYQEHLYLTISIFLDSIISWREPKYSFTVNSAVIHCLNPVQPKEKTSLSVFSAKHQYQIQPSKVSFLDKKILTQCFIPIRIPDNHKLSTNIRIQISGAQFDFISINTNPNTAVKGYNALLNTTVPKESVIRNIWELNLFITPLFNVRDEITLIVIDVEVQGIVEEIYRTKEMSSIGSHPIPGFIMIPVLVLVLFGIPYFYVYKEELKEKKDHIIDSDLGKM